MFITLPESSRRGKRSTAWTFASVVAHAAVLGVWLANQGIPTATAAAPENRHVVFVPPQPKPVTRPVHPVATAPSGLPSIPGVPTIETPRIDVAAVSAPLGSFDPATYDPRGTTAGPGFGVTSEPTPVAGMVLTDRDVDRRVEPRAGNPIPRYPPSLASMGVEGRVIVRFVVDTLGTVDRSTVQVLLATHPLFEKSVREALVRMRFVPAELRRSRVAQLVELPFHFETKR